MSDAPTKVLPNESYTAERLLEVARELGIRGRLVRRGRRTETREYPVRLDSGAILWTRVTASPELHCRGE